jgi:hypothetical protein
MQPFLNAWSLLAATGALMAFHVGLYTLVGRERKAPYVINSRFRPIPVVPIGCSGRCTWGFASNILASSGAPFRGDTPLICLPSNVLRSLPGHDPLSLSHR